jgi:integrase
VATLVKLFERNIMKIYHSYFLRKRENGFYYLGYEIDGRRHWKTTKCTKRIDALELLKNYNAEAVLPACELLLSDIYNQLKSSKTLRATTLRCYNTSINKFKKFCGDKPISDYKLSDLEKFKQFNSEHKVSDTTINIYMRSIISAFSFAVKKQYLKENPFPLSQSIKVAKKPPVFVSQPEFEALLNKVTNDTVKELFIVAANSGMTFS